MKIEFPEDADDFIEGIILLDEAVGRFMQSDNEYAYVLERLISNIVMIFDNENDKERSFEQLHKVCSIDYSRDK